LVGRVRGMLEGVERSHVWFREQRDPAGIDCVSIAHPWESGMDNCPAWDDAMERIDPGLAPVFERRDKDKVANAAQERPTDDHYKRYAVLVKAIAANNYGHGLFAVYCPLMTSLLAKAEVDLARLAARAGDDAMAARAMERAATLSRGMMAHMWSAKLGRFTFVDGKTKEQIKPNAIGCYVPLVMNNTPFPLPEEATKALLENLARDFLSAPYPLPSIPPSETELFDSRRYWRGPSWVNINYLIAEALPAPMREDLVARTLDMIAKAGFYEYFDPITGEGIGADSFSWTASLAMEWLKPLMDN